MQEARYYEPLGEEQVWCHLCPHNCKIKAGQLGICCGRQNIER